ncbi:MAG TPA: hypothetical protein VF736_11080 [Pyrinomonadaceae bacterium]
MRRHLIAIVSVLALAGCEPPRDDSRFVSAGLAPDGRTGVFVYKRELYYPGSIGLLGPGRPNRYVVNRSVIGAYDLATGETRVLYRRDNGGKYVNESLDFRVVEIRGSRALVADEGGHYWLDTESGALTALRLREELAARGREVGAVYLADERGTLVFVNKALADIRKPSAAEEIWLRRHTGEYERVSEVPPSSGGFYAFKDGEVHFYSAARHSYLIYNLERRDFRKGDRRDIPHRDVYDRAVDFRASEHGSPQPQVGRKVGGRWEYADAHVNVKEL